MSSHLVNVLILGISIYSLLVQAAPHCAKPVQNKGNCSITFKGPPNYKSQEIVFQDSRTLNCSIIDNDINVLEIRYLPVGSNDETNTNWISFVSPNGNNWMNIHCSDERDTNGKNMIYLKALDKIYAVDNIWCNSYTLTIEEYKKKVRPDISLYIDWTPEMAQQS